MMRSSALGFPTRREIILVFGLFVVLLYVSHRDQASSLLSPRTYGSEADEQQLEALEPVKEVSFPAPKLRWTDSVPETTILAHAFGWTMMDNLYICNGTMFVVTSDPASIPNRDFMTSTGYEIHNGDEEKRKRLPTDKDIRIVTPSEARELFGTTFATRIDGMNWLNTDPPQFVSHYFHWAAELTFGFWRTYAQLDPFITADGRTTLPAPKRMMFSHVDSKWRDYASMNQWVTRGAFPSIAVEDSADWVDRAKMERPFVFDRVILADRAAAMKGPYFGTTWRTASEAFIFRGGPHWWSPVRVNVLEFSGLAAEWIHGPDPGLKEDRSKFVITYISRQTWGRRKLIQADHDVLVEELEKLRDDYGYELNVVSMEKLSRLEQFQLAGRTTIMMGVHGNGLTSLVWMRPQPRATVIEFFFPQGVAFDYEWTTRALNMVHYGVWNNKTFTAPDVPKFPKYPDGFQGNAIPLDGRVVAELVQERLSLGDDDDS